MQNIALRSLVHDRGKLAAALAGVALSATLALVQLGIYAGFLQACSAVISQVGGDLWVMGRDVPVFDFGRVLPETTRTLLAEHPCVARVRGVVIAWVDTQTAKSPHVDAFFVGFDPVPDHVVP